MLGRLYRLEGRRVLRCTHGGDRGFFDDPLWAYSELQESDEYWVHGAAEARSIERRLTDRRILTPSYLPTIHAAGSPKHVISFLKGKECRVSSNDRKRVALVASLFTGEWLHGTFTFKLPDSLVADLQIHLLRLLKDAGYYVMVRPHPRGLLPQLGLVEKFYLPHCDEILTGPFDPNGIAADALLFDFAGSAWFDALASSKGILLVDTGDRRFDPEGLSDLNNRCAVVKARRIPCGGYRLTQEEIVTGLQNAMTKAVCTEKFANDYFGLSLVRDC